MPRLLRILLLLSVAAALALLAAHLLTPPPALATRPLRIGMDLSADAYDPSFASKDSSGQPVGLCVDLIREFAASIGQPAEILDLPAHQLIPALQANQIDLVASPLPIPHAPIPSIAFSDPYFTTGPCVLAGGRSNVFSINDVDHPGVRVTVCTGSTAHQWAVANLKSATLIQKPTTTECVELVRNEQADCLLGDQTTIFRAYLKKDTFKLRILLIPFQKEKWAIALRKSDPATLRRLNQFLDKTIQGKGGDRLFEKHFKGVKEAWRRWLNPPGWRLYP